jgi:hypothetical protein
MAGLVPAIHVVQLTEAEKVCHVALDQVMIIY